MLLKPITLVILCTALAVFGRDELGVATYTRDLEQEPVNGQCVKDRNMAPGWRYLYLRDQ